MRALYGLHDDLETLLFERLLSLLPFSFTEGFTDGCDWRPHDDLGVTDKFDDVSAVEVYARDQILHVAVYAECKLLGALAAILGATLAQPGEAADVSKNDNSLHPLQIWTLFLRLVWIPHLFNKFLDDERRNELR